MVWTIQDGINHVLNKAGIPASILKELRQVNLLLSQAEINSAASRLSLAAKIHLAIDATQNDDYDQNFILWVQPGDRKLNNLLRKPQHSAHVVELFEALDDENKIGLTSPNRKNYHLQLYRKLKALLDMPNPDTAHFLRLLREDYTLVSVILNTNQDLRQKFWKTTINLAPYTFEKILSFIVSHPRLADELKTYLNYIVNHPVSMNDPKVMLSLRTQLAIGNGALRRAIRNHPHYFSDKPDLYIQLFYYGENSNSVKTVKKTQSIRWRIDNVLKKLIPRFLLDWLNIEPPLSSNEISKLQQHYLPTQNLGGKKNRLTENTVNVSVAPHHGQPTIAVGAQGKEFVDMRGQTPTKKSSYNSTLQHLLTPKSPAHQAEYRQQTPLDQTSSKTSTIRGTHPKRTPSAPLSAIPSHLGGEYRLQTPPVHSSLGSQPTDLSMPAVNGQTPQYRIQTPPVGSSLISNSSNLPRPTLNGHTPEYQPQTPVQSSPGYQPQTPVAPSTEDTQMNQTLSAPLVFNADDVRSGNVDTFIDDISPIRSLIH